MVAETQVKPAGVKPFREIQNGILRKLNFHIGQMRAFESSARFIFLLGGTQVGKTCFGPHWLDREIKLRGPGDYLAVTATYPLLKLKMLPEFLYVFETLFHLGKWRESDKVFEFYYDKEHPEEQTRVIFGSATNPESLESGTAKAAWLDEVGQDQFKREAWDAVIRRLSLAQGRILGTTTLYSLGWLKGEVYDKWVAGDESIDVIQVDSITNPAFPEEEYELQRARLPRWKFNLFYRGQYDRPAGMVYDSFDEAVCKIPRFPLDDEAHKHWPRYVGHDFGGANPAALFFAQDPATGFFYIYEEYLPGSGRSTAEHVEKFKALTAGVNVVKRVGGSHQEEEIREAYRAHGWPIGEPKVRSVEAGIDRVYAMHKLNKLFVFADMWSYLDEKMRYSRKLDDSYQPTDEIADKARFHLMDAERYMLSDFAPETVEQQEGFRVFRY